VSNIIAWIAAVAESPDPVPLGEEEELSRNSTSGAADGLSVEQVPAHQFPAVPLTLEQDATPAQPEQADAIDEWFELDRQRRVYRGRTVGLLRKYMRYSLETERLPSLVGREFFRSKVTSYRVTTFEDRVIFVHDMESCLQRLDELSRKVLARIVLQEYEHEQAAQLLGCSRMTVHRWLLEALDKLIDILLAAGLLEVLPPRVEKSCQGGKEGNFCGSDGEQRK
jgi:RNA polymerase sigma factor (sigma-70 family)